MPSYYAAHVFTSSTESFLDGVDGGGFQIGHPTYHNIQHIYIDWYSYTATYCATNVENISVSYGGVENISVSLYVWYEPRYHDVGIAYMMCVGNQTLHHVRMAYDTEFLILAVNVNTSTLNSSVNRSSFIIIVF